MFRLTRFRGELIRAATISVETVSARGTAIIVVSWPGRHGVAPGRYLRQRQSLAMCGFVWVGPFVGQIIDYDAQRDLYLLRKV